MIAYPRIDPVAIKLGPLKIHWYGLMYLGGFLIGWWLGRRRARRTDAPLQPDQVGDLLFYVAAGVILGGRAGYVLLYNFPRFLEDPLWLFAVWEGGMAFHGGLIGVAVALLAYARKLGCRWFDLTDFVAPLVPPGLGLGRIGNFIGGELWGRETSAPWGMVFPTDPEQLVRHPSQLYQAALEGVLLFAVLWWFSAKPRPRMAVSGALLLGYGLQRLLVELFRQPDAHIGFDLFGSITRGQLLSTPMVLAGILLVVLAYRNHHRTAA
ncbi:MAG: prolipoprotein diacylglyceryl transferase [Pseudomonadota bacterium]|nr:prolipoprotein diacylglyceryl transferase [Pseudomonadota bacterium]